MNLLLIVLLNKTRFTATKTRFFGFLVDFWTRNLVYFEASNSGILLQHRNIFTPSKTRFFGFLVDFWTRNPAYFEATNSGILLQHSNILETILCSVVNLLLIVLLNKTRFTESKTRFLSFLVDFWTRNLVYLKATNSGMLLQGTNILEATFCTVVNLLLTVLRNL